MAPPYHLRTKLENMPHTKGFIYGGAAWFGTADAATYKYNPTDEYVLLHLVDKSTMHVTKYNSKEWKVYEKNLFTRKERLIKSGNIIQFEYNRL